MGGVQFTRESAERIARTVRAVEATPHTVSRPNRASGVDRDRSIVGIRNDCAYTLVRGSIVKISDRTTDGAYKATKPDHAGLSALAVVASVTTPGAVGSAWVEGVHPVLAYSSDTATPGARVDVLPNCHYVTQQLWGRATVLDGSGAPIYASIYYAYIEVAQLCRGEALGSGPRVFRHYANDNAYWAGHTPRTVVLNGLRLRPVTYIEAEYMPPSGAWGQWPQGAWVLESDGGGVVNRDQDPLPNAGLLLIGDGLTIADLGDGIFRITKAGL